MSDCPHVDDGVILFTKESANLELIGDIIDLLSSEGPLLL